MLPRIPLIKEAADFKEFAKAGRDLAEWHLNYETVELYPVSEHSNTLALDPEELFKVQKMLFGRKDKAIDETTTIFNNHVKVCNIPLEAYDYVVNSKPAIGMDHGALSAHARQGQRHRQRSERRAWRRSRSSSRCRR